VSAWRAAVVGAVLGSVLGFTLGLTSINRPLANAVVLYVLCASVGALLGLGAAALHRAVRAARDRVPSGHGDRR